MGCLVWARLEKFPHFGQSLAFHSAVKRVNRLVYSTHVGFSFRLPEGSLHKFVEDKKGLGVVS